MAVFSSAIPLLLLFLSVSSPSVNGNVAPSGGDCSSIVITNMGKCLPFVKIGSQDDKPDASCCSGLKTVLDTKAECLCEALKESVSKDIKVNITKAATLPTVCKVKAPSMTACLSPTKSPASAPAPVPAAARPLPGPGSGSPSASAPAPSPDSNHGSSLIPISGWSFALSGALVLLFSRI